MWETFSRSFSSWAWVPFPAPGGPNNTNLTPWGMLSQESFIITHHQLAENLQKNGGFVLGIRPGKPTQDYLNRVIVRITLGGALFLGTIAIMPYIASLITDVQAISLSSTSLLIMVGVGLDTLRQLEAQLMMRNYEGFLR